MSFTAPNAVWLHRSQPFRLKNYAALRSNSLVKLCPGSGASLGVCLYSRAYLAGTTALLNSVRAYTALVPIGALAAMEFRAPSHSGRVPFGEYAADWIVERPNPAA